MTFNFPLSRTATGVSIEDYYPRAAGQQVKGNPAGAPAIPAGAGDITAAWLNAVLEPHLAGHRVIGCRAKPHGEPGQTADIVDIQLHYDSALCPLPSRMIAKLAASDAITRDLCKIFRHYERETAFYGSFNDGDLPLARCFHARHDSGTQDTVILLEHLAPSYCPSFAISFDQVSLALREAARLHARYWNDACLQQHPGLVSLNDREHWANGARGAVAGIDKVASLLGDDGAASIATMRACEDNLDAIMAFARGRPFTLQHSDYHPKQLFFPDAQGQGKFAVIDFQFSVAGSGAWDVARLLNLGLDSQVRTAGQADLIAAYLDALAGHGVTGYGEDEFLVDFKLGIMMTQLINFIAVDQTDVALIARECADFGLDWKEVWLMRGERMIREFDLPDFLRSL